MLIRIALKIAYKVTKNHPLLWFFGLFLVGGFNIFLIKLVGIPDLFHINSIPTLSNTQTLLTFFLIVVLLVVGNIARVALIVYILKKTQHELVNLSPGLKTIFLEVFLNNDQDSFGKIFLIALKRSLLPTISTSIVANLFLFLAAVVVFAPQLLFFIGGSQTQSFLVFIFLFLPLALIGLFINMVTPLFIIVLGYNFSSSLRLAYDLLIKRFNLIIGIILILGFLYFLVSFFALLLSGQIAIVFGYGFSSVLLIFALAIMNAFCHASLLILFLLIVRPIKSLQVTKPLVAQPTLGHQRY